LTKRNGKMKLNQLLSTPVGAILLAIAIVIEKFIPGSPAIDFTIGFLLGLSVVLNIYYIFVVVSKRAKGEAK
jgi:hypothetical protein